MVIASRILKRPLSLSYVDHKNDRTPILRRLPHVWPLQIRYFGTLLSRADIGVNMYGVKGGEASKRSS